MKKNSPLTRQKRQGRKRIKEKQGLRKKTLVGGRALLEKRKKREKN